MKRWLKEPLLHFLLLGAGLFLAYRLMPRTAGDAQPGEIRVSSGQIEHLAAGFAKTWQRAPSPDELKGLIRDRVREEVYYREALALGLDKEDTVIRRRLRQKMEFVSEDIAAQAVPSETELNAYLQAHAEAFRVPSRITFGHVYLDPKKHGDHLAQDTAQLLAQLNQAGRLAEISTLGDPLMVESQFENVSVGEITSQFGKKFAAQLSRASLGQWQGPVESGYGVHLVMVSRRTEGRLPALAEVRDAVAREWSSARRSEANEKFYQQLLQRYTVTIEVPKPAEGERKLAQAK